MCNVISSPAVANGVVYVGGGDGSVYALNAATEGKRWCFTTGVFLPRETPGQRRQHAMASVALTLK